MQAEEYCRQLEAGAAQRLDGKEARREATALRGELERALERTAEQTAAAARLRQEVADARAAVADPGAAQVRGEGGGRAFDRVLDHSGSLACLRAPLACHAGAGGAAAGTGGAAGG